MEPSDFRAVLKELVEEVPGAWGAIFVDWEGESVDLYATSDAYEVKLAGAHAGLLLSRVVTAGRESLVGRTQALLVRTDEHHLFIHTLDEEYFVLLATRPTPHAGLARNRLAAAVEDLRRLV